MNDVMIDFETLGNGTHKCLCQVGAVYFDRVTGELGKSYKANIDAGSHQAIGGRLEADTVYWWLSQSKEAQDTLLQDRKDVKVVMGELNEFLKDSKRIWSHATFDFVTLMETMKQCGIKPHFNYKSGLDIRTLVYLAGTGVTQHKRDGIHHDGLADAIFQVKYTVDALNALKDNKAAIAFLNKLSS